MKYSKLILKLRDEERTGCRKVRDSKFNCVGRDWTLTDDGMERHFRDPNDPLYDEDDPDVISRRYQDPFILVDREKDSWSEIYRSDPMFYTNYEDD